MDKEEQLRGLFSTPFSEDLNSQTLVAANLRLHNCTPQTNQQAELMETLVRLPAIGLKLQISPSLVKQAMQRSTKSKRMRTNHDQARSRRENDGERLKASILGALMLRIGSWQLEARNEGDLVAKCYFAKRQLVWEILRNGLKEKIEIEWSNIIGIQASMEENKPGILEVELHHPPKFYKEIEPEPRKHTQWTDGSDFTEGQACVNRRHCILFPPKVLDKHYQKLINKDQRLFELSQSGFPTFNFPYFPSAAVYNQISSIQFEEMRFKIPSFPLYHAAAIDSITSPRSVVDYTPHFNEIMTQQEQRMEALNQVNTMRRYEEEAGNYYNGGKPMINEYDNGIYKTDPMASMVWLANNIGAAANNNLSQQRQSSSFDHHFECFNGDVMNIQVPSGVSNAHFLNYPTYSNSL